MPDDSPLAQVPLQRLANDVADRLAPLVSADLGRIPKACRDADRSHDHRDLGHGSPRLRWSAGRAGVIGHTVLPDPVLPALGKAVAKRLVVSHNVARVDAA